MLGDESEGGKTRGASSLEDGVIKPPLPCMERAIIPIEKGTMVGAMVNQFEPLAPPSPNPVRDPKRKKTDEEEVNNGALAGSAPGHRQAQ
jgi:hypothetical protein